jgi:hypothetical protein
VHRRWPRRRLACVAAAGFATLFGLGLYFLVNAMLSHNAHLLRLRNRHDASPDRFQRARRRLSLLVVVIALSRQIGILYERIAPMGALDADSGPKVGDGTGLLLPTLDAPNCSAGAGARTAAVDPVADLPGLQEAAADPEVGQEGRGRAA